jgi:mannosyltransferase
MSDRVDIGEVDILAPNFKRRLSGVTSTIVQLIPCQIRLGARIAAIGPGLPAGIPGIGWGQLLSAWKAPAGRTHRIWHARRNNEMLAGIVMRHVLRMPFRLLFTSAAQRQHKPFTRWMIRRMDRVVATSEMSGSFLQVPYTTVLHGIDTSSFHPPRGKEDTISATDLPGRYLIGCFGRIRHQKGTDLFVRAMIDLLPHYPDWTAVISGRATSEHREFEAGLKRIIDEAGLGDRIVFLGEVPDIRVWYRRLDLYVAPSRNEGFGLTPLEAMASQTAVVTSDAGAYREMIVQGVNGAIVEAGDGDGLRDAIAPYLADPGMTGETGLRALDHVRKHFALESEAQALNSIYESMLRL